MTTTPLPLAYCLSAGYSICVSCAECRELRQVDLLALIVRFGEGATVQQLWAKGFKCPKHGTRARSLTVAVDAPSYRKVLELE